MAYLPAGPIPGKASLPQGSAIGRRCENRAAASLTVAGRGASPRGHDPGTCLCGGIMGCHTVGGAV